MRCLVQLCVLCSNAALSNIDAVAVPPLTGNLPIALQLKAQHSKSSFATMRQSIGSNVIFGS